MFNFFMWKFVHTTKRYIYIMIYLHNNVFKGVLLLLSLLIDRKFWEVKGQHFGMQRPQYNTLRMGLTDVIFKSQDVHNY